MCNRNFYLAVFKVTLLHKTFCYIVKGRISNKSSGLFTAQTLFFSNFLTLKNKAFTRNSSGLTISFNIRLVFFSGPRSEFVIYMNCGNGKIHLIRQCKKCIKHTHGVRTSGKSDDYPVPGIYHIFFQYRFFNLL